MASNLNTAMLGAALTEGAADIPFRTARLQEAQSRAKMSQMQTQAYEEQAPARKAQVDAQTAQLQQQLYQTNAQMAKQQTYDAFQRYQMDGDPKHLNQWLTGAKSNPVASNLTADMTRMDRVTRSPENDKILQAAGIKDLDGFYDHPEISSSFVMGTTAEGHKTLIDMNRMYAVTGYSQQLTDQAMQKLSTNAALIGQLRQGGNMRGMKADSELVGQVAAATGMQRSEVYQMLQPNPVAGLDYTPRTQGGGAGGGSALERIAAQLRHEDKTLSFRDSLTQALELAKPGGATRGSGETQFVNEYMQQNPDASREDAIGVYRKAGRDERTSAIKNTEYGEEAKTELDNAFGGDFLSPEVKLDNLDPQQERIVSNNINRIEQVGGLKLSPEDKKNARAIRKLLPTANRAATQLSDEDTGLLDSTMRNVKSYITNNVPGKDGAIAYEALRAMQRNALFGKAVSSADRSDLNKVLGTLGQQTGPVLAYMRQNLELMRDDLSATADMGDPYVAKVRYGATVHQLDNIVNGINDRLDLLNSAGSSRAGGGTESGLKVNITPQYGQPQPALQQPASVSGERPALQSIFGGQQ